MAMYHCSVKVGSRSTGQSACASAAYRSGEVIKSEYEEKTFSYPKKQDIISLPVILPENAPEEYRDRGKLWNAVELSEKRKDSQLFREIEVALPNELSLEQCKALIKDYLEPYVKMGMIADPNIHWKKGNHHAHIMLTMREVSREGFGKKNREWNAKDLLENIRSQWAEKANEHLEKNGFRETIDHRSFKDRGIEREPTIHMGPEATAMERKGKVTRRGNKNRAIRARNKELLRNKSESQRPTITQQEYDYANNRINVLTKAHNKYNELMERAEEIKTNYKEINAEYEKYKFHTSKQKQKHDEFRTETIEQIETIKNKCKAVQEWVYQKINVKDIVLDDIPFEIARVKNLLKGYSVIKNEPIKANVPILEKPTMTESEAVEMNKIILRLRNAFDKSKELNLQENEIKTALGEATTEYQKYKFHTPNQKKKYEDFKYAEEYRLMDIQTNRIILQEQLYQETGIKDIKAEDIPKIIETMKEKVKEHRIIKDAPVKALEGAKSNQRESVLEKIKEAQKELKTQNTKPKAKIKHRELER